MRETTAVDLENGRDRRNVLPRGISDDHPFFAGRKNKVRSRGMAESHSLIYDSSTELSMKRHKSKSTAYVWFPILILSFS
jgi:hypothetical protein